MDDAEKTLSGSAFQILVAATGNARLPIVESSKDGRSECASTGHTGKIGKWLQVVWCSATENFVHFLYDGKLCEFEWFQCVCVVRRIRSKEEMWRHVEAALSNLTANEMLSALCSLANETADGLAQKTAAVNIAKDAEQLRYEICIRK